MGASAREIERQIRETRDRIDANLRRLEGRAASSAVRYGLIGAAVVGVLAVGGVAFLVYRRRPPRRARRPEPGTVSKIVRQLAPALAAAASTALVRRLSRLSRPTDETAR
ncbi:MAG TPA: hypothetical protein VEN12_00270 [Verrucomicrobiae bacterium]|nr:hypothetical protein [Verrucomicrobiae bacterium]